MKEKSLEMFGVTNAAMHPTRDELFLEELGSQFVVAKEEENEVLLTVWGWDEQLTGLWKWSHVQARFTGLMTT
ncbi:hypothetical protein [Paenibacillus radicis (ex Xue et al. 2023)]|uniref:Uncharacterized protein n=1 Tax=Paenibacillus radicis (ex Xue et al. 2023) TaxID=2972489 RepID=A0ABT1YMK5_9BACL|nr:hypothetical protein [Paenibacillus radicis (ex Xue et al. 2023)]MCR8633523.1 hypothetical protein [Paenibacillus radicis (ex Xue et al. 2023)]